jgi:hypothetical protein
VAYGDPGCSGGMVMMTWTRRWAVVRTVLAIYLFPHPRTIKPVVDSEGELEERTLLRYSAPRALI